MLHRIPTSSLILIFFFLLENLATEIEVWKDMKKIKHLPAPLSQKKAMRLQYQVPIILEN